MFKDEREGFLRLKIISGSDIPGCIDGIVPAANIICAVGDTTLGSSSVVSHSPIWNHVAEFKGVAKSRDSIVFILRDADQILGSVQISVKGAVKGNISEQEIELINHGKPCSITFTASLDERMTLRKKSILMFKDTVLSRFGSDQDLSRSPTSGTRAAPDVEEGKRKSGRAVQRCHSYVNERMRSGKNLSRHQYVNCGKQRTCGELAKNIDMTKLRAKTIKQGEGGKKLLVLIQGRNLGSCPSDVLSVHIGGLECTNDIQHVSPEKILVRVPRGAPLSPVSIVTKSGGVGQQNAKVKVSYESANTSAEMKSLARSTAGSEDSGVVSHDGGVVSLDQSPPCPHKPPRGFTRDRHSTRSSGVFSTSSDSGSDGMCVNSSRSSKRLFVAPPRRRAGSQSSTKSEYESISERSPVASPATSRKDSTITRGDFSNPTCPPSPRKIDIVAVQTAARDIIAPPTNFAEGASPLTEPDIGRDGIYDMTKSELIAEVLKLREALSQL